MIARPTKPARAEQRYAATLQRRSTAIHVALMRKLAPMIAKLSSGRADSARRADAPEAPVDLSALIRVIDDAELVVPVVAAAALETTAASVAATTINDARRVFGIDFTVGPGVARVQDRWVTRNVDLITRVDAAYFARIRQEVTAAVRDGVSSDVLTATLRDALGITQRHAQLIAVDQCGKLNGDITKYNQVRLGVTHYKWSTVRDERVRPEHQILEGQVFAWDKPHPVEGHPGFAIRCRCVAIPIIDKAVYEKTAKT